MVRVADMLFFPGNRSANARAGAVASAAEQLSSSVDEISRQVTHSADIANGTVEEANRTSEMIEGLNQAAQNSAMWWVLFRTSRVKPTCWL